MATATILLIGNQAAFAQQPRLSPWALDMTAAVDETADADGNRATGVILDAVLSAGLARRVEVIVRPFAQRLPTGEWNRQIWIAAVRYERPGPIGIRLDAGLIPPPIGLANLNLRPHLNPTIAQPSSLFTPLPPLEPRGARATLLGGIYPYGASLTVSGRRWDARAALMDTSPVRVRRIFATTNPPRFANVLIGGGVSPVAGLRVGASVTRGGWQQRGEAPFVDAQRDATITTLEGEYEYRFTKVGGEWTRDRLETSAGTRVASGWFVQGVHAVTPRWFAAGRVERMRAPAVFWLGGLQDAPFVTTQRLAGYEATIGYRVTPALTIRASHRARMSFGRPTLTRTFAMSVVWWQRWH